MPAPTDRRERRHVTVLFSDLKGFTSLAEKMDPEEVEELLHNLLIRFRKVVEGEGGTVDKFIGDAVMAVWGAPKAHEDDALRAVRAGLKLQQETAAFNTEERLNLKIRVGINSGEVLWGGTGGDRPTATGDAVNVAQRLEGACTPEKVLVSQPVARSTLERIKYRKLDVLHVKGRDEPVQPYEAIEDLGYTPAYREVLGIKTSLVGRDREMGWLKESFRNVCEMGCPRYLWIEGEAGVGKSRLVYEFRVKGTGIVSHSGPGILSQAGSG
jgi:class 3 adenylate cyclase